MPKQERRRKGAARHNPLHEDIGDLQGAPRLSEKGKLPQKGKIRAAANARDDEIVCDALDDDGDDAVPMPPSGVNRLLKMVESQQKENFIGVDDEGDNFGSDVEVEVDAEGFAVIECKEDEEDEAFMRQRKVNNVSASASVSINLADLVMQQLANAERQKNENAVSAQPQSSLSPKVVEVYTAMAPFLARYRSGKVPKAFKVIPRLQLWEEVLLLTNPPLWSTQATREATKIFCSSLKENMAQRFISLILMPAVRDDISENKKLNYHLYQALKKSLFKPGAFFKGLYLPLAIDGCSVRESVIVGSVVSKVSIPVLHGSAALCRLAWIEPSQWTPSASHLMSVLIEKKYSLPKRAVDECVNHFHRFTHFPTRQLPVAWHKCLLVLVQRYKAHLTEEQRIKLKMVIKLFVHDKVTPEIKKELAAKNPYLALQLKQSALREAATNAENSENADIDIDS